MAEPSWRGDGGAGCHRGGAPQRPLDAERRSVHPFNEQRFASDYAFMARDKRVKCATAAKRAGGLLPRLARSA